MGAAESTTDAHSPPAVALHVLRVAPGSPAAHTSLEAFFDFIVGVSGFDASADYGQDAALDRLEALVAAHEERALELVVWSCKTREARLVPVTPSRAWGEGGLLGLSMRVCRPHGALDNVWRVLDVLEGSPAESAGLVPLGDWIVGWSGGPLFAERDLYEVVQAHVDTPLRVYVYSYDFDTLREVVLVPNRQWGGEGLLGCVFGFGILHRIPVVPTSAAASANTIFRPPSTVPASSFTSLPTSMPASVPASDSESGSGSGVVVRREREARSDGDRDEDFVY